jgi:PAS domain S-box-containing protein
MTIIPQNETEQMAARALQIIETMPGFAWSADAAGRFTYVSPNALGFLGRTPADLNEPGQEDEFGWRRVVHPDDYERVATRWRHCLRTGDHYDAEHRLRRADGTYRWFRNSGRPSRDGQGRIIQWYGTTLDIDEQKQLESVLRERERELSQLVDMVPSHVWRLTPQGEPTFFNKRMSDYLGMGVADMGRSGAGGSEALVATVHPEDAAAFRRTLAHALATGDRFALRYRLRRDDGVYHWMSSRAEPLRDAGGTIVQWFGVCHDIDDQVKAEEALRRSEQQLRQLIDAVPVDILSFAPSGRMSYASKRYLEKVGSPPPHIEDFDALAREVAHPEDFPTMFLRASNGFATGTPFVNRFRRREKDGGYRWVEARAQPLRDADGTIVQWYIASVDIEDQMRAQQALRESERMLRQLVETLPALIYCAAPDGKPIYRSRQLSEYLGFRLEDQDEAGKPRLTSTLDAIIHPDDLAAVQERYAHSLATGEPYAKRHRLRRFDGAYRWVETRAAPMRNTEGAIVQWTGVCMDIDGEVRAQEELRLAQERLARAGQAASLAELSASIAHEVNQPLAAVVANSHACQRWLGADPPNIERAQRTVERIIRDANAAADVVSRIRALFKQSFEARTRASVAAIFAEVSELLAEEATRRRIRIDGRVEGDLPLVMLDRVQIQQVFVNLMRNGMEAMDPIATERILKVRVRRKDDAVETEISDLGPGLAFPERIFEPFFTTKDQGLGMGLAICRSIVESHAGRLWAEENEPQGARFIFTLPVEAEAAR